MSQSATANKQLHDAFELFNQVSEQLAGSYQLLQQKVVELDRNLAESRSERQRLLDEIRILQQQSSREQRLSTMGEMTARLAHQIRTPLATALLYASQLKHANLRREQHDCFVDRLLVGLRHLDHMVNDMLIFARGGRGGEENVPVSGLLEQVRQSLIPQLNQSKARWRVSAITRDPVVRAQREVLASVLSNLATNALHACGNGASLHWHVDVRGSVAELALQDNGPGVPDELRERIFEPFFTTRSNGTGLGLAVVRAVIKAHGGEIELDTGYESGARFVVRLPLRDVKVELPSEMLQKQQKAEDARSRCV
jgi:two-component system sensor histidine kinase FlrB